MKKLILFAIMAILSTAAFAQEKVTPRYRINSHYFTAELPNKDVFALKKPISSIKDDSGNRVFNILVDDGFVIPDAFKKYEIAFDNVNNVEQFEEKGNNIAKMHQLTHSGKDSIVIGKPLDGFFQEQDLKGNIWCNDSLRGHVTVINVWYSGCGPCRKEMHILSEWKNKHSDVLFLSADFEDAEKVKDITEKEGFNWNHIVKDTYFTKMVGNAGYPLTIVLDREGKVRYFKNGTNEIIRKEILDTIESLE